MKKFNIILGLIILGLIMNVNAVREYGQNYEKECINDMIKMTLKRKRFCITLLIKES